MFTIGVENQTEYFWAFAIASLAQNATVEDLGLYLVRAKETIDTLETGFGSQFHFAVRSKKLTVLHAERVPGLAAR